MVGYPDLFPQSGGCWPAVPIANGDIAYLRWSSSSVNAMLAADTRAAGATFVNTYTPTIGHDFCKPESVRDVEGLLLRGSLELPFHPNARGQQVMANAVLAALRSLSLIQQSVAAAAAAQVSGRAAGASGISSAGQLVG